MTDKYTLEQKAVRLSELSEHGRGSEIAWINTASLYATWEEFIRHRPGLEKYQKHYRTTWDVHTGLAFTKLYKALK